LLLDRNRVGVCVGFYLTGRKGTRKGNAAHLNDLCGNCLRVRKFLPAIRFTIDKRRQVSRVRNVDMSHPDTPETNMKSPTVTKLFRDYLQRQTEAHAAGLAANDVEGDVIPHEAAATPPADPRLAWEEAAAVIRHFSPAGSNACIASPTGWPGVVSALEPIAAVPFAFGNFPQLVRDVRSLLSAARMRDLRSTSTHPLSVSDMEPWLGGDSGSREECPRAILAAGVLRLARNFERAAGLLQSCRDRLSQRWKPLLENEEATLKWSRGEEEEAIYLWKAQPANAPIRFNLGMAALFRDQPEEARRAFSDAANALPETSGWHHLAKLYSALAEMRS
jgi:hypothetical protein